MNNYTILSKLLTRYCTGNVAQNKRRIIDIPKAIEDARLQQASEAPEPRWTL